MYEIDYIDCKYENKEYMCYICNVGLCYYCVLYYFLNLYYNVIYDCIYDKKFYFCLKCDRFLCVNCVGNYLYFFFKDYFYNRKMNYFSCRYENKIY